MTVNLFIYPRTVSVTRSKTVAGTTDVIGPAGYSGVENSTAADNPEGVSVLLTNIPASIQAAASGKKKDSSLPQDVVYAPTWNIFIPLESLPRNTIRDRDYITDDNGYRYEVGQAYWNSLGWKLVCVRQEA